MRKQSKLRLGDLTNPWVRFRSQTGFSQAALAGLMKLGQPAISSYEAGSFPEVAIAKRFVELSRKHRVRMDLDEIYAALQ